MNPLSAAYGIGVSIRNYLYDQGMLKAKHLQSPVISVGNLSVGGSGKTPFVIALGALLREAGYEVDVLSRGYGRASTRVSAVDPGGAVTDFGDEPLLIRKRLGVAVYVGASRHEAGVLAERTISPSSKRLHLLDDGFQHRELARQFDIVLLDEADLIASLLPVGRLREPASSLQRADAIVVFGENLSSEDGLSAQSLPERRAQNNLAFDQLQGALRKSNWRGSIWRARRHTDFSGAFRGAVAFCGIAKPRRFFEEMKSSGIEPAAEICFRDHHRYRDQDVARLLELRASLPGAGFVCTEKDEINLGPLTRALQPLYTAPMAIEFYYPDRTVEEIRAKLTLPSNRVRE